MRLDKLLANIGYGSRKEVKKMLKQGGVLIDGVPAKGGNEHVEPEKQEISVFGEPIEYQEYIYLMMNKPAGVISATEDEVQETVIDLLEFEDAVRGMFPVGRLDKDTTGLLLLTNDGKFSHALTSPKKGLTKTYEALINKPITEEDVLEFRDGVYLDDGYKTKPAVLSQKENGQPNEITLVITEGKFHQVKRMFESVGKKVLQLKRTHIGSLPLDEDLEPGEYREMAKDDVEKLLEEAYQKPGD